MIESIRRVSPAKALRGAVSAPSDKSVSHRAALFASLYDGVTTLSNYSLAEDPQSTLGCIRALGFEVETELESEAMTVRITGEGRSGWKRRANGHHYELDCGNSGTTMRLLSGLVAGAGVRCSLFGDESLSRRPMERILTPLRELGADVEARDNRFAPIEFGRGQRGEAAAATQQAANEPSSFPLAIASAQVKSCLLLAGLFTKGGVRVKEPVQSRDHTERMLGIEKGADGFLTANENVSIPPQTMRIPGDMSSAAFWLVAGAVHPDADLSVRDCGLNPTRSGILQVLQQMGAELEIDLDSQDAREPIGTIRVRSSRLRPVHLRGAIIPNIIDELPIIMAAMCFADGVSEISDAGELRVKETDRIAAMCANLRKAGANVTEKPDGVIIQGSGDFKPRLDPNELFDSEHDHRIAMTCAVLALCGEGRSRDTEIAESQASTTSDSDDSYEPGGMGILRADASAVSYPDFWLHLESLTS